MKIRTRRNDQNGFTLVEVMVAVFILLVGVLGVVTMVDAANARTAQTKSREAGTNLAREVTEAARSINYSRLVSGSSAALEADLQDQPALHDHDQGKSGWQIDRRGITYRVTTTPRTVAGSHVSVDVGVRWTQATRDQEVQQAALISNPAGVDDPAVTSLTPASATITSGSSQTFNVVTARDAAGVNWLLDGAVQGSATGSAKAWSFPWSLTSVVDGTYLIGAQAYDANGSVGVPRISSVVVNRSAPAAPGGLAVGRNAGVDGQGNPVSVVDMEWLKSPERDVLRYQVTRRVVAPGGAVTTSTISCGEPEEPECQDQAPPSAGSYATLTYSVLAIDLTTAGAERAGTSSAQVAVVTGNTPPNAPRDLQATASGDAVNLSWLAPTAKSPADPVEFYRVYRDGELYEHRYDRTNAQSGGRFVYSDTNPGGASHTYAVTAVDRDLGESSFLGPVSP